MVRRAMRYVLSSRMLHPAFTATLAVLIAGGVVAFSGAQQPGPTLAAAGGPDDPNQEVLTRGPVHEAFAEAVSLNPTPGLVAPKAPPEQIEELPPDQKPEGDNVEWIPGYWAWDDDRADYLWVSGVWRAIPPGRQWIAGYWRGVPDGAQWVSGYWGDAAAGGVDYLPEPPQTLEVGPSVAAPSPDQTWIPGSWVWRQTRYAWRPGFWFVPQPNWVWVPNYYVWAPGGYISVGGYWDYLPVQRGVLFAPVYFNAGVYARPGFFYSPATVINLAIFGNHLFCRPNYRHYYFGDYYAANYLGGGFYPWFSYSRHQGYDPFWAHQNWNHRNDRNWARNVENDFNHRRDQPDARPPRTWNDVQRFANREPGNRDDPRNVARSLGDEVKSKDAPVRFQQIDKNTRSKFARHEQEFKQMREQRQKIEASTDVLSSKKPTRVQMPKSPITSLPTGGGDNKVAQPGGSRRNRDFERNQQQTGRRETNGSPNGAQGEPIIKQPGDIPTTGPTTGDVVTTPPANGQPITRQGGRRLQVPATGLPTTGQQVPQRRGNRTFSQPPTTGTRPENKVTPETGPTVNPVDPVNPPTGTGGGQSQFKRRGGGEPQGNPATGGGNNSGSRNSNRSFKQPENKDVAPPQAGSVEPPKQTSRSGGGQPGSFGRGRAFSSQAPQPKPQEQEKKEGDK